MTGEATRAGGIRKAAAGLSGRRFGRPVRPGGRPSG
jgi:hypothetical protein